MSKHDVTPLSYRGTTFSSSLLLDEGITNVRLVKKVFSIKIFGHSRTLISFIFTYITYSKLLDIVLMYIAWFILNIIILFVTK